MKNQNSPSVLNKAMLVEYLKTYIFSSLWGENGLFSKGRIRNTKWDPVPEYTSVNANQGFSSSSSASQDSIRLSKMHWDGDLLQKLFCAHYLTKQYYNFLASISVKLNPLLFAWITS